MKRILIALVPFALAGIASAHAAGPVAPKPVPKKPAPTVEQLQKQLEEQGAFDLKACSGGICIILVGDGGSCRCMEYNQQGVCVQWECGLTGEWGPIVVPKPEEPTLSAK